MNDHAESTPPPLPPMPLVTAPPKDLAQEFYERSTNVAGLCKAIVTATAMEIQKRKYVKVEGWQAIAATHGCVASCDHVEELPSGIRAVAELRRLSDGVVLAKAEGFVGIDEPLWYGGEVERWDREERCYKMVKVPPRPTYAVRAMAQTRAISRVCRGAFAHVVVLMNAGLETTPADEVPPGGFERPEREPDPARGETTAHEPLPPKVKIKKAEAREVAPAPAPAPAPTTPEWPADPADESDLTVEKAKAVLTLKGNALGAQPRKNLQMLVDNAKEYIVEGHKAGRGVEAAAIVAAAQFLLKHTS